MKEFGNSTELRASNKQNASTARSSVGAGAISVKIERFMYIYCTSASVTVATSKSLRSEWSSRSTADIPILVMRWGILFHPIVVTNAQVSFSEIILINNVLKWRKSMALNSKKKECSFIHCLLNLNDSGTFWD